MNIIASISILISAIVVFFTSVQINKLINKRQDLIKEQEQEAAKYFDLCTTYYNNIMDLRQMVMDMYKEILNSDLHINTDNQLKMIDSYLKIKKSDVPHSNNNDKEHE